MRVTATPQKQVPVWDLGVRLFHWTLLAAVALAGVTGFLLAPNWLNWHIAGGAAAGLLVVLRLIWGLTGPTYARFRNFTLAPSAVLAHLRDIGAGKVHREGGHNPLGAWMVVALLLTLSGIVVSGLIMLGGMFKQGPGKSLLSYDAGALLREPHELLAWLLLALVAAHVAGVIFESRRSAENLARSMVTGTKREGFSPAARVFATQPTSAALATGLCLLAIAGAVLGLNSRATYGVPSTQPLAAYEKECGDCHIAFHPTLLPASSWALVMSSLDDHFGEDASLDSAVAQQLKDYLAANGAETSDSFAAHAFRKVAADEPRRITATPFWKRRHGEIDDAVFKRSTIKTRTNCAACHADAAAGAFAPQNISIPPETTP